MKSLSIIVPVYKVEPYIEKCITSIFENRLFDSHCELIVVDDGSPDHSMEIVESLCASRQNVTLVRQNNQGLGMARNTGASKAEGEYLWFVDSDDWLPNHAIEKILALIEATDPDVVNIDHVMSNGQHNTVVNNASSNAVYTGFEYLRLSIVQNPVQYYIYRTNFYRGSSLHFEKKIYHEDTLFTPTALFLAQRVVRLAEDCYVYNMRAGSIMTSGNNLKHVRDTIHLVRKLEDFRKQHSVVFRQSHVLSRYTVLAFGAIFYYWKLLGKSERRMVSGEIDFKMMLEPICYSGLLKYIVPLIIMFCRKPFAIPRNSYKG